MRPLLLELVSQEFFVRHRSHSLFSSRHSSDERNPADVTTRSTGFGRRDQDVSASRFLRTTPQETYMQARMKNPIAVLPDAFKALMVLNKATENADLPYITRKLVELRASQINGCSVCVVMHAHELRKAGEKDDRIVAVAAWRVAPYFNDAERAALALTEAATRLADRADPVPDEVWDEAARHYEERALAALVIEIGMINFWNRLNAATRQIAGQWNA